MQPSIFTPRYVNMDYIFASSLKNHAMPEVVTSYDIACQWSRNLRTRHDTYALAFDHREHELIYLVPKFHLPAHQMSCQYGYNFNYTKGVGRTDGEAVERGWAAVNPFATSTKEMGPGHRRDVLDDVFATYNWGKVRQMGEHSHITPFFLLLTACRQRTGSPQENQGCCRELQHSKDSIRRV